MAVGSGLGAFNAAMAGGGRSLSILLFADTSGLGRGLMSLRGDGLSVFLGGGITASRLVLGLFRGGGTRSLSIGLFSMGLVGSIGGLLLSGGAVSGGGGVLEIDTGGG